MNSSVAAMLQAVQGESVVLEEVRAKAVLHDLFGEVEITQRYRNPEKTNIEAVYTFPLPLDAVLLSFDVTIGERELKGVVVEKSEAERRYEDAITDGDAAVLLEQPELGLYTANVGNLPAGETATIRFTYGQFLRWNGDRVRFMMPTTIAPRYGDWSTEPHQEPSYDFETERSFSLKVVVQGLLKDATFNSPSHDVRVTPKSQETTIEFTGGRTMDRDFILEAQATQSKPAGAVISRDIDGWVALASFRPEISEAREWERRCVKIVVDCSGSMGGDSIAQARVALERIVESLRPGDVFDIIAFGNLHDVLFGQAKTVSETTLAEARQFVRKLDANMGGTEIGKALDAAYAIENQPGLPRDLLLITDGEITDTERVITRARNSGHRIFTVGVGSAVAEAFVRQVAEVSGGACELVAPREDMAERVHRHFQRMYAPRARTAQVRWPTQPTRVLPQALETVYAGDTLHVFGWFTEKPQGIVTLEVVLADGQKTTQEAEIVSFENMSATEGDELPTTLARMAAARSLITLENSNKSACDLAVRYKLMSRWTDYLVVCPLSEGQKANGLPVLRKVPQVLAAGWHGMGTVNIKIISVDEASVDCRVPPRLKRSIKSMMSRISKGDHLNVPSAPIPREMGMMFKKLMESLAEKRPLFHSEADFQFALAWEIQNHAPDDYAIRLEYPLPGNSHNNNQRIDIWLEGEEGIKIAIELKYVTMKFEGVIRGERFNLKNQLAHDGRRYDFLKDVQRIGRLIKQNHITLGFAILLTNDPKYWKEPERVWKQTNDAAFRLHEGQLFSVGEKLNWGPRAAKGTKAGREVPLELSYGFQAKWLDYGRTESDVPKLKWMMVELPAMARQG